MHLRSLNRLWKSKQRREHEQDEDKEEEEEEEQQQQQLSPSKKLCPKRPDAPSSEPRFEDPIGSYS
jgi:hypothetical protein